MTTLKKIPILALAALIFCTGTTQPLSLSFDSPTSTQYAFSWQQACLGVLAVGFIYMLWENHRIRKNHKELFDLVKDWMRGNLTRDVTIDSLKKLGQSNQNSFDDLQRDLSLLNGRVNTVEGNYVTQASMKRHVKKTTDPIFVRLERIEEGEQSRTEDETYVDASEGIVESPAPVGFSPPHTPFAVDWDEPVGTVTNHWTGEQSSPPQH
jgi:hypothetical protein